MKIISLFMVLLLALSVPVLAEEDAEETEDTEELPEPTILPNSGLYGLKRAWERLGNLLVIRAGARVERALMLAEKRLAEAKAMVEQDLDEYVSGLSDEYEEHLERANEIAKLSKEEKIRAKLARVISRATAKHLKALAKAEKRIAKARAKVIKENIKALRILAREYPEEAAELAMETAEDLAEEAEEEAEDDEEASEIVDEYEEYANFGKEISEIAQQVGKDPMKVIELVRAATSKHLLVLARVREKVPEKAKVAITRTIERSEKKIEDHVKRLEAIKLRIRERKGNEEEPEEESEEGTEEPDIEMTVTGDLVIRRKH